MKVYELIQELAQYPADMDVDINVTCNQISTNECSIDININENLPIEEVNTYIARYKISDNLNKLLIKCEL